jgi:hypothetical protein
MSHLLKAPFNIWAAFALAALITGTMPPLSPHWRAVAADLHQAMPQAKVKAAVLTLLHGRKG